MKMGWQIRSALRPYYRSGNIVPNFPMANVPSKIWNLLIRIIESLDPDDDSPRYFRSTRPPNDEGEEKSEAETWLDMVSGLDYSAKILIGYCLAEAARVAVDKSKEWVKLAGAVGVSHGVQ